MQAHLDIPVTHFGWQPQYPSPLSSDSSNASNCSPAYPHTSSQYDSPRGAKRSRSRTFSRDSDMDVDSRRLRPNLPLLTTSTFSAGLPTPPLSASSSVSSAGSSLASISNFPRSFSSFHGWQPSSAGVMPLCISPEDMADAHTHEASRIAQSFQPAIVGQDELQNYANKGFATPAMGAQELYDYRPKAQPHPVVDRVHSFSGPPTRYPSPATSFPTRRASQPSAYPSSSSSCTAIIPDGASYSNIPTPPPAPTLDEQHLQFNPASEQKPWDQEKFVEGLVGTSMLAIQSIWSTSVNPSADGKSSSKVLPLKYFIKETLRRSRSGVSTLQVALYYLHRARVQIRERVLLAERAKERFALLSAQRQREQQDHLNATGFPTPPGSPSEDFTNAAAEVLSTSRDPVVCGRRMFLAALISASKFLQDRNYSNRAWSRLSGLPVSEINANERAFLDVMGYDLFVRPETFQNWNGRLQKLAAENEAKIQLLTGSNKAKSSLERSQSDYMPAPEALEQPVGSFSSPKAQIPLSKSALARSMTEMDMHRRRASTSVAGLPGFTDTGISARPSPNLTPRRASDAFRYGACSMPRLVTRASSFAPSAPGSLHNSPFALNARRPAVPRRISSSECRLQQSACPQFFNNKMETVC